MWKTTREVSAICRSIYYVSILVGQFFFLKQQTIDSFKLYRSSYELSMFAGVDEWSLKHIHMNPLKDRQSTWSFRMNGILMVWLKKTTKWLESSHKVLTLYLSRFWILGSMLNSIFSKISSCKLLETMLVDRLNTEIVKKDTLSKNQLGFRWKKIYYWCFGKN